MKEAIIDHQRQSEAIRGNHVLRLWGAGPHRRLRLQSLQLTPSLGVNHVGKLLGVDGTEAAAELIPCMQ